MNTNPKIKICGLTDADLAYQTACLSVDYIGLVFHPSSKRHLTLQQAKPIAHAARKGGAIPIAVCVDQTTEQMLQICHELNIDTVQLHGDISRQKQQQLPDSIHRIYSVTVDSNGKIQQDISALSTLSPTRDYLLFDGENPGSGEIYQRQNLAQYAAGFRYFIAGGLNATNIQSLIHETDVYGVDVSSGVEINPGVKSIDSIKDFIQQLYN